MKNKSTESAIKQTDGIGTGLKQGSVRLVKYKPEWKDIFGSEVDRLRACVGDITLQIEHVGSTSVPGLIAKPIIDIAIAVESRKDMFLVVERLLNAGYIDGGDQGGDGGYQSKDSAQAFGFYIFTLLKRPMYSGEITLRFVIVSVRTKIFGKNMLT